MSTSTINATTSRSTQTTPIRAIPSTLSNKAAPSIPPASQGYEPLIKALFRHRLRSLFLSSAAFSWVTSTAWSWWQRGGASNLGLFGIFTLPIGPWILFSALVTWVVVALPISILRKVFLTARRSAATSPLVIINEALGKHSTEISTIVCVVSSVAALVLHTFMTYVQELDSYGNPKLFLFVKSKKHPHYLNGRLLFLVISQVCVALVFNLRWVMVDRFAYKWTLALNRKNTSITLVVAMGGLIAVVFATLSIILAFAAFLTLRSALPLLYKIPFLPLVLRPFTAHFLKGSWSVSLLLYNFALVFRAWFLAFTTLATWELVDGLFDNVTEPIALSLLSADPEVTLVSGLSSSDRVFQYFAFSELRDLAVDTSTSASARRTKVFGDQKTALNLWSCLSHESLLVLDGDFQTFLRRGKPPPPVLSTAPVKPTPVANPTIATPTPLLRQRVFKTSSGSPGQAAMDALASDGPISKAIDIGADATHVPEIFRSVEHKVVSPIAEETKKTVRNVTGIGGRWKGKVAALAIKVESQYLPAPVKRVWGLFWGWMTTKRESRVVEASLPFWEMDITVIEALSHLICSSLTEDQYGIVQRDIPKVLETFISFLQAVEQYQAEFAVRSRPLSPAVAPQQVDEQKDRLAEIAQAQELLQIVGDSLKEGVLRITLTFGDSLRAFKFPPRISGKLETFLEYS